MITLLLRLKTTALALNQFAAQYWRYLALGVVLLLGGLALRSCYQAGRNEQAARDTPPLSVRQVRTIKKENAVLHRQAARVEHQKDSVVARVQLSDQRLTHTEHQVDSLTHVYEQVPVVVARTADAALFRHLSDYSPSPFPDTTGR